MVGLGIARRRGGSSNRKVCNRVKCSRGVCWLSGKHCWAVAEAFLPVVCLKVAALLHYQALRTPWRNWEFGLAGLECRLVGPKYRQHRMRLLMYCCFGWVLEALLEN